LKAFAGNTNAALNMGFNLMIMKSYLSYDSPKIEDVLEGLNHAIVALYPYTQFHHVCHDMYMKVVGGDLTREEEEAKETRSEVLNSILSLKVGLTARAEDRSTLIFEANGGILRQDLFMRQSPQ
jgi:hypothetical protein